MSAAPISSHTPQFTSGDGSKLRKSNSAPSEFGESSVEVIYPNNDYDDTKHSSQVEDKLITALEQLTIDDSPGEEEEIQSEVAPRPRGHSRSTVHADMSFQEPPVALYKSFCSRMIAVEFQLPIYIEESKDTHSRKKAVTNTLLENIENERRNFSEVTANLIKAKKKEILNTITSERDRKTALIYLKKSGIILEPIFNRLQTIRNLLARRFMAMKKITPFEKQFSNEIRKLYTLDQINQAGIKEGKVLSTFIESFSELTLIDKRYRKIVKHALGDTTKERAEVISQLRKYCTL